MDMESNTEALGFDWVHKETASARTVIVAENIFPFRLTPNRNWFRKEKPHPQKNFKLYDASVQDFTLVLISVQKPLYIVNGDIYSQNNVVVVFIIILSKAKEDFFISESNTEIPDSQKKAQESHFSPYTPTQFDRVSFSFSFFLGWFI